MVIMSPPGDMGLKVILRAGVKCFSTAPTSVFARVWMWWLMVRLYSDVVVPVSLSMTRTISS